MIFVSYIIRSSLVAECHHGHLVVVHIQRPVQSVYIAVFGVVIQTAIAPYLILYTPMEPFQFSIGLGASHYRLFLSFDYQHACKVQCYHGPSYKPHCNSATIWCYYGTKYYYGYQGVSYILPPKFYIYYTRI